MKVRTNLRCKHIFRAAILIAMLAGSWILPAEAAQIEMQRRWSEIPFFLGQEIAVTLPDWTYVQGKALSVRGDALDMDVKKTSDHRLHPKGKMTIPRSSVSIIELHMKRSGTNGAKVVGGAGTLGGLIIGGYIGSKINGEGGVLVGTAVGTVAGAIGGLLAGRQLDHGQETTLIKIIPETQETAKHSENRPDPSHAEGEAPDFQKFAVASSYVEPTLNPAPELDSQGSGLPAIHRRVLLKSKLAEDFQDPGSTTIDVK